jgi:hypothetical protein
VTEHRFRAVLLIAAVGALLMSASATAHPEQHPDIDGHLTGSGAWGNLEFVSKAVVTADEDRVADVTVNPAGTYAFLADWGGPCTTSESGGQTVPDAGAWVVDIRDLGNPRKVGYIPAHQDSRPGEGMQVVNITTPRFSGDVLVMNNEQYCATTGKTEGKGGVSLFDVSNPLKPVKLSENWGDRGFGDMHDIHSAFAWDAGDRAYVVIVDNFEWPDVDILDITNPKRPVLIAEYDLNLFGVAQPEYGLTESFIHDMIVKQINGRWIMLVSYWDGGYVKLDVTNPAAATFIGDTDYAAVDPLLRKRTGIVLTPEGNGHQAEFTIDDKYFIATDEDFDPYRSTKFKIPSLDREYDTAPTGGGAPVTFLPDKKLNGPVVYGGYGCPSSAPIPPASSVNWGALAAGEEKIVVLQRGPVDDPSAPEGACFPGEKAAAGKAAGYDAVVLVSRHTSDGAAGDVPYCGSGAFPAEPIVTVCTTHTAYHHMFESEPAFDLPYVASKEPTRGQVGRRIEVGSTFDGWGYVHLFDANTMADLDQYAIPEAHDPEKAFGYGDLSVHEVAVDPDEANRAYLSYYSGGMRVLEIRRGKLVETGGYLDPRGNDFWGVETFVRGGRTIVLGSDRDSGLWVFRQR